MKSVFKAFIFSCTVAFAMSASAQQQLTVSTGSAAGTYSKMFKELAGVCGSQMPLVEKNSTGSVENLDRILNNEVNGAFVQTDALFHRARNEDLSAIKTLAALYPEEVHIVALANSNIKEGGIAGIGAKAVVLNDITNLAGRTVATWGGSTITAQVIRLQAEIDYKIAEVSNFAEAYKALQQGHVAAIMMVGGQPLDDIAKAGREIKLLSFPEAVAAKLKSVYVPAKLNYSSLGQGGSGIQSIATEALFVTRSYKTPKIVESLGALRGCFKANVDEIAETTGTHKKWRMVSADNQGKWAYYELPNVAQKKK